MVRLAWTKNGASDVMVHKTSAITTGPTDGTGYAVGNTIDGATVIYRGAATALEHVDAGQRECLQVLLRQFGQLLFDWHRGVRHDGDVSGE